MIRRGSASPTTDFHPAAKQATRLVALATFVGIVVLMLAGVAKAAAAPTDEPLVPLGAAANYAVFGVSVNNLLATQVDRDLGVQTAVGAITGFPPGIVHGIIKRGDAPAQKAIDAAYDDARKRTPTDVMAGDLNGQTVGPGVHRFGAAFGPLTGALTLDAQNDPNAVFIFQIDGALNTAAHSRIILSNGAAADHVFWEALGAAGTGADSAFAGTILSNAAITLGLNTVFNGQALSRNAAITMAHNQFTVAPLVAIDGGLERLTNNPTGAITGITSAEAGTLLTVTVDAQVLTSQVQPNGLWSVTPPIKLIDGPHHVLAVVNLRGSAGTATQVLTVDTIPPVVTITGGPSALTNQRTPTLFGTTDADPGTPVHVVVAGQTLTTKVIDGGRWVVTTGHLTDAAHVVQAAVTDPAGNTGTTIQVLTVDTTPPKVMINGGPRATTKNANPTIAGTTDAAPDTAVHVTVGYQQLVTKVRADRSWLVTTSTLPDSLQDVTVTISDPAGNHGIAQQQLLVDTLGPIITINGGPQVSTSDSTPLISGTTDAAAGTPLTVTVGSQQLTTRVLPHGTWSVTAASLARGDHDVVARVSDPAGNMATANQLLKELAPRNTTPAQTVVLGSDALVSGDGFTPGEKVAVWLHSVRTQLGTLTVDAKGEVTGRFPIPATTNLGVHHIGLINVAGSEFLSQAITVIAPAVGPVVGPTIPAAGSAATGPPRTLPRSSGSEATLPFTGLDLSFGWWGLASLLLGALALVVGRDDRRQHRPRRV